MNKLIYFLLIIIKLKYIFKVENIVDSEFESCCFNLNDCESVNAMYKKSDEIFVIYRVVLGICSWLHSRSTTLLSSI